MRRNSLTLVLLVLLSTSLLLEAHSFSAFFDSSQTFSVTGTIVRVDWVKPNVFIHVRVDDATTGKTDTWAFETLPPNPLVGAYHVTRDMFREGDKITVLGWKAKAGANWKEAIADAELAARVIAEKAAYAAQFEFVDGKKVAVVQQVPVLR